MISIEEYAKLNNLVNSCDELIGGKFILSEYKIAKILKDIGESKTMYELLADCMKNFNFDREFSRAEISLPKNKFVIPEEPEKLLPFVFCLLMEINNKKLDLNAFLKTYYTTDDGADPFTNFVNSTVRPFRDIIVEAFELDKAPIQQEPAPAPEAPTPEPSPEAPAETPAEQESADEPEEETISEEDYNEFFDECSKICEEILQEIKFEKKKNMIEDVEYIVGTMKSACAEKNFKYLSALITSFSYIGENLKSIRFLTRELKNILISFFS